MVVVAVPGGTSGIGRAIVDGIKEYGKHQVIILSRKANPKLEAEIGVPIFGVDYKDVAGITKLFEDQGVHTVISAIKNSYSRDDPDVTMIRAAQASGPTKRYIPSEFGVKFSDEQYKSFPTVSAKLQTYELLRSTDLQYTNVFVGFFLDYWGIPHYPSYLTQFVIALDIENKAAAIPGAGNTPVVFTHTLDIGKYVAKYLDVPQWDPEVYIIGDKVTFNEFVSLAEEARAAKFDVVHDSVKDLRAGKVTALPGQATTEITEEETMRAMFGLWFDDGTFDMNPRETLNDLFPDIQPLTVKEIVNRAWKGR